MTNRPDQNPSGWLQSALDRLVGEWQMVGTHPAFEAAAHGRSTFEWLSDGGLLVWRFEWESPGPPSAMSVIGWDDAGGLLTMLYSDVRGVYRIYLMEFDGRTWTMQRESPGFSQRMSGIALARRQEDHCPRRADPRRRQLGGRSERRVHPGAVSRR